jgi:hypothetical protein
MPQVPVDIGTVCCSDAICAARDRLQQDVDMLKQCWRDSVQVHWQQLCAGNSRTLHQAG